MQSPSSQRLSISLIIPCYNDVDALSVLLNQACMIGLDEIIVVDGGSYDGSQKCARHTDGVSLLMSKKGRGQQIATGVAHAKSELVWVLHADCQIPDGALNEINRIMSLPETAMGCFPLAFETDNRVLNLYAWLSKFDSPVTTFGDQGFFCRQEDYFAFGNGSYYPLLEDVAFRQFILGKTKRRVKKSRTKLTTSARRFENGGYIKTQLFNARILWRYFCGASPLDLYNEYYADPLPQIFNDPALRSRYPDFKNNKS